MTSKNISLVMQNVRDALGSDGDIENDDSLIFDQRSGGPDYIDSLLAIQIAVEIEEMSSLRVSASDLHGIRTWGELRSILLACLTRQG